MNSSVAVVIATKGRPAEVSKLITHLRGQTELPDIIVVSTCTSSDIDADLLSDLQVKLIFGSPGLTAQRNRALASLSNQTEIIIFFDDDFIPSRFWIERAKILFASHADVVCISGKVLKDGGVGATEGEAIVHRADVVAPHFTARDHDVTEWLSPYGCNMAVRFKSLDDIRFDERLVLYGWLEDRDFGVRLGSRGRIVQANALWGVHFARTMRGRGSTGLTFGYSQVVNPWYLMRKGTMTPLEALRYIARSLIGNSINFFDDRTDRRGRLKGNVLGLADIILRRWAPEKIAKL
jgi:GT2 family glycosyltransferase